MPLMLLFIVTGQAQFSSAQLTASGLTCAMCTKAIYNALEKLPAVSKVEADIAHSSFMIHFKPDVQADPDALQQAVTQAGFSVSRLTLSGNFHHLTVGGDGHLLVGGKVFHLLKADSGTVLDGRRSLSMVDRKFMGTREFRKYAPAGRHDCLETGKAEVCCPKNMVAGNTRIYHALIL